LEERIPMPGGTHRSTAPRDLAPDPDLWPHAPLPGQPQAQVVQAIARALEREMGRQDLSLRQLGLRSGINRQVITNLLRGDSWPDVVTVSRLEDGLGVSLWPGRRAGLRPSRESISDT
jgi:ribosome-binding protein aMBF1 (putative translation factor)